MMAAGLWGRVRVGLFSPIAPGLYLRTDAAVAYNLMRDAALADGVELIPSGPRAAARTTAMQASLQVDRPDFAAPVGTSKHEIGIAIDIDLIDDSGKERPAKAWLKKNAGSYGFVNTVVREPWHFEYKGFGA